MIFPPVWYKVRHPWFDPDTAYRAIWYVLPSETAWGHLVFIRETGHTVAVRVSWCTALRTCCEARSLTPFATSRPLTDTEREQPFATKDMLPGPNPDLDVDLR